MSCHARQACDAGSERLVQEVALEAWEAHLQPLMARRPMASNVKKLKRAARQAAKRGAARERHRPLTTRVQT
jgi:hypothetical protein